jgi:hypothetical protein
MHTILFMVGGVNIGVAEILIVLLALFVVFLIIRNFFVQPLE